MKNMWMVFLLQDKYSTDFQKQNIKNNLINRLNYMNEDVCYIPYQQDFGLSYYFFVKQKNDDDMQKILQLIPYAFESFNLHVKITQDQFYEMIRQVKKYQRGDDIKYGDLVLINKGCYNKLYGIVLRQGRGDKYDVGLKFRFGTVVKKISKEDIKVVDNIFKHIKVLH